MSQINQFATHLLEALDFAAQKHRDQRRKGAEASPYINHPIQVAEVLASVGGVDDEATLLAAILHDTIEDTDTTPADLTERFGEEVCELVLAVSDDKTLSKDERKRLQVTHSSELPDKAKLVKIADKICNVRDIGSKPPLDWDAKRRKEYFDWATKVVDACAGVNANLESYFAECVEEAHARMG